MGGARQSGQPGPLRQVLARSFGNRFAALAAGLGVTSLLCRLHNALQLKLRYGSSWCALGAVGSKPEPCLDLA